MQHQLLLLLLLALLATCRAADENDREVHAFYYSWYRAPLPHEDGAPNSSAWAHWGHSILPHWTEAVRAQFPGAETRWLPPHDIHAPFYPARGPYTSTDAAVARAQMADLRAHGVAAAVVSWWGRPGVSGGDSQGVLTDAALQTALEACAAEGGIGVALHLEPYSGRSAQSVREDLEYLRERYFAHPGLHRWRGRPVLYVYDSYHIAPAEWARVLAPGGDLSVRGAPADAHFIGLWLERGHGSELRAGGFDGAYTYFAADGFSYGASSQHWPAMAAEAAALGLLFAPSVGPGYDDSKIRPWNQAQVRERGAGGEYYAGMWAAALAARPALVGVTSYNEWGEGTQIEGAAPRATDVERLAPLGLALPRETRERLRLLPPLREGYRDYGPRGPQMYMEMTASFAAQLRAQGGGAEL